jgi:alpha-D-xyloside xylohydrolase
MPPIETTTSFLTYKIRRTLLWLLLSMLTLPEGYGQLRYKEMPDEVVVYTKQSQLIINKKQWHVALKDNKGTILFEEASAPAFQANDKWFPVSSIDNIRKLNEHALQLQLYLENNGSAIAKVEVLNNNAFRINIQPSGVKATAIRLTNKLRPKEEVYGLGEMWNGTVAQRGNAVELWDKNGTPDECAYIPYYVTTSNYAYFLDYGGRVNVDVGKAESDKIILDAPASNISILLTSGDNISQTVSNYLKVTGLPIVPPRWSFKPWWWLMSAYDKPRADISTLNAKEVLIAARKFKELDMPAGVTWLEPPWQTARTSLHPSDKFSSDFKGFVDTLHHMGLKLLCWTIPYTLPNSSNWNAVVKKNYLVKKPNGELPEVTITPSGEMLAGGYHYIDFTNPAARRFWQSEIESVLKYGIDGFKLDAGQDLPEDAILYGGKLGKDLHNSFANYYNSTFFEILNRKLKGDFLTIPRSSWAGANKYHSFKWPGDLSTTFDTNGLPSSVYSSISAGFSGFSNLSTDIGGFSPRPSPENVWVRWAQFGAMLPGMQTPNMPWWYSKKASDYYRYLSWLHTDMTPFWMSLANHAHTTGVPIVRHLVWTFQDDEKAWAVDDEFTLGESILVAPVTDDKNSRKVYLPKGNWFNFFTDEKVSGQQEINWKGDLYQFPIYLREGAIIPLEVENEVSGFGTTKSKGYVTVAIWPQSSGESNFILHDREQPVNFSVKQSAGKPLLVKWSESKKNYILRLNMEDNKIPKRIASASNNLTHFNSLSAFNNSTKDGWYYDEAKQKLWIKRSSTVHQNEIEIYK